MGLTHFRRDRAGADRARPFARDSGDGGALGARGPIRRRIVGTLATLPALIARARHEAAGHHRGGEVVRLREKLNWYERLPLFGQRIVVTRARGQADDARRAAAARWAPTSSNCRRSRSAGRGLRAARQRHRRPRALRLADLHQRQRRPLFSGAPGSLGRRSARLAREDLRHRTGHPRAPWRALHLKVDLMGKEYVAESLVEAFAAVRSDGQARPAAARGRGARCGARRNSRGAARRWTWSKPTAR